MAIPTLYRMSNQKSTSELCLKLYEKAAMSIQRLPERRVQLCGSLPLGNGRRASCEVARQQHRFPQHGV